MTVTDRKLLERIWNEVAAIPRGEVASYGGVARRAGLPRRARLVGHALKVAPAALKLPWHRVLNAQGRISLPAGSKAHRMQRRLLEEEGVRFRNGRVDLSRSGAQDLDALLWKPRRGWYHRAGPETERSMASRHVVFSHGQESGPWGTKISAMAEVAKSEGWSVDSVDYRGVGDPRDRVTRLLSFCRDLRGDLVLVGSSMGGWVATSASALLHARGLFLMAPAFYMPGMEQLTAKPAPCPMAIVHGWKDDVVPVENSLRFAREHSATLHILDSDHRLHSALSLVNYLFEYFLVALDLPKRR